MKNIIWAAMPKLLTMVLLITVLMFISGAQRAAKAQCTDSCTTEWGPTNTIYISDSNNYCFYNIQYKIRQCTSGGVAHCEVYFDKIESVSGSCCYGNTWPSLNVLVKMIAKSIATNFYSMTGCDSSNCVVKFPSCWKITTANQLAEACITAPCCSYQGGNYIPAFPAPNCSTSPYLCIRICN
jgi:hypothetical protein